MLSTKWLPFHSGLNVFWKYVQSWAQNFHYIVVQAPHGMF